MSNENLNQVEIPLNKSKLFLLTVVCFLFTGIGIYMFLDANDFVLKTIAILAILIFATGIVSGLKKLFNKNPGLIIDSEGITDNSNGLNIDLIPWNDITEIKSNSFRGIKTILIYVRNPEEYIEKAKTKRASVILKDNMKTNGTPFSIASNTLKYNFEELEQLLNAKLKE